jgi:hypothetical protein
MPCTVVLQIDLVRVRARASIRYRQFKNACFKLFFFDIEENVFFNTKRYVDVSKIELGSRTFEDVEAGGYENCAFKHYRTTYLFRCKILTTEVERTLPGIVPANNKFKRDEHSEYQLSNLKKT